MAMDSDNFTLVLELYHRLVKTENLPLNERRAQIEAFLQEDAKDPFDGLQRRLRWIIREEAPKGYMPKNELFHTWVQAQLDDETAK